MPHEQPNLGDGERLQRCSGSMSKTFICPRSHCRSDSRSSTQIRASRGTCNRVNSVDMSLRDKIFGAFEFTSLGDPDYQEDAVREDIVAPLLRSIGYNSSGPHRMVRSRRLTHPYVMLGSTRKKLSIVPDYVLEVDGKPCLVLDAKSPGQDVTQGDHVAQVYSYAIHPEIRAWSYGLCNGRLLALYDVRSLQPRRVFDLTRIDDATVLEINQKLNPRTVAHDGIMGYDLDGGTYMAMVMGMSHDTTIHFASVPIGKIVRIAEGIFTMSVVVTDMAERHLMLTFDWDAAMMDQLLQQIPHDKGVEVRTSMSAFPFHYYDPTSPPCLHITCRLPTEPQFSTAGEMFLPLRVTRFRQAVA